MGVFVANQRSSGSRSTVRKGLIISPDAQIGLSLVFQ